MKIEYEYDYEPQYSTVSIFDAFEESEEAYLKLNKFASFVYGNLPKKDKCIIFDLNLIFMNPKYYDQDKFDYEPSKITMTTLTEMHKQMSYYSIDKIMPLDDLTFESMPKLSLPVYYFLYKNKPLIISQLIQLKHQEESIPIPFPKPILLNAQNSKDRNNYGKEYWGDTLIYSKNYGSTSNYFLFGFTVSRNTNIFSFDQFVF